MLVAAAVCPAPPLLVPETAGGPDAARELDELRAACDRAVAALTAAAPAGILVVGVGDAPDVTMHPWGATGDLRRFGIQDWTVQLGTGRPPVPGAELPTSLALGAWLLARAGWDGPVAGCAVPPNLATEDCLALGRDAAAGEARTAVLVMGDGSACRTEKAPGYLDPRAADYDAAVAEALKNADVDFLKNLNPALSTELWAAGRAPWQVLAGAAEDAGLTGGLLYDEAPYGVGYFTALWS